MEPPVPLDRDWHSECGVRMEETGQRPSGLIRKAVSLDRDR